MYRFTVEVDVQRVSGKFASRDDIEAVIQQALEDADPGSVDGTAEPPTRKRR